MQRSPKRQPPTRGNVSAPHECLWVLIGLLLTIGGNFLEAYITDFPWNWSQQGIQSYSLGVTYQMGAVLLVGCLGGKNAGAFSQIAYLIIGLIWLPVFYQGGGFAYVKQPSFGYILGFIPGAWVCGYLAFKMPPRLEFLAFSCVCGLLSIHLIGIIYLILSQVFHWAGTEALPLWQACKIYSFHPLPGQVAVLCAVAVVAFILRQLMFY